MGNEQTELMIANAVEVLSGTYAPADTIEGSARRYTSVQVAQAVHDLTGVAVSVETVYAVMTEYGYRYVVDESSPGLKYVWLLKYRVE